MRRKSDVAVVSCFGRGNWLAHQLVAQGLSVSLLDVSDSLGRWAPEDWEGPFGLFLSEKLTGSQLARINEEDDYDRVDEGFCFWLKDGPMDLKGPFSSYWLEKYPWLSDTRAYLSAFEGGDQQFIQEVHDELESKSFEESWMIHLAHHIPTQTFCESREAHRVGRPLSLFAPWALRRVTRRGTQKSLQWCEAQGVTVYNSVQLKDLLLEGKECRGLEIKSEWSGLVEADQVVWMLSSEETVKSSSHLGSLLFPQGPVLSEWSWMRFRLNLKLGAYRQTLPQKFVMIQELALPWTHTNLLIVDRTVNQEDLDVWVRLPSHHRFQRSYLEEICENLLEVFNRRIPDCEAKKVEMPQDYHYEYQELGPPRFPIYSSSALAQLRPSKLSNIRYDGPEWWRGLDWGSRFEAHQKILQSLVSWKQKQLEKLGENSDRALHPS